MHTLRKTSVLTVALALVLALLIGVVAMFGGRPAGAETDGPDVPPVLITNDSNPTCAQQGYAREFKIESEDLVDNELYNDGILNVTISNLQYSGGEPVQFDWASNIGVDAVLVKASPAANAYIYDPPGPEQLADDGLIAPDNKGISHISFCYDLNLEVSKTAQTSLDRTYSWTIDKSADQTELTLEPGEPATLNYEVTLGNTHEDSNHAVEGVITITNPDPDNAATVTDVTDQITGGIDADVICDGEPFPITIPAGGTLECDYSAALPDDSDRTNTATVTTSGAVPGGSGTAPVSFDNATVTEIDEEITVDDTNADGPQDETVSANEAPKVLTYSREVSFDECGDYEVPNTASFVTVDDDNDTDANGQSSWNVDVTVLCKVTVKKTVDGVVNPNSSIDFTLTGPGLPSGGVTLNTKDDLDGILDFGYTLVPGQKYTLCENPVPAGFTSFWKLDGVIVSPYNPGDSKVPQEDLGVRCYDFTASAGKTPAFVIDNSHPGGDPRTIGYWKNWNTCTSGNQATTAAKNGGAAAGVYLLNDLLPQTIGDLYLPKSATGCQQAVKILSKQNLSGKNMASDAAYELASQLLAAKLNLAAGAETCSGVQTAVMNGQALLANSPTDTPKGVNFNGTGSYLPSNTKLTALRTQALSLAASLDKYNNGDLC